MAQNRKLIAEQRTREEHQTKARTDHSVTRPKSAPSPRRNARERTSHTVRPRDAHGRRVETARPAAPREAPELAMPTAGVSGASSDAAPLLFMIFAYAAMVVFFAGLVVGI